MIYVLILSVIPDISVQGESIASPYRVDVVDNDDGSSVVSMLINVEDRSDSSSDQSVGEVSLLGVGSRHLGGKGGGRVSSDSDSDSDSDISHSMLDT
jgi:hypothetical protein